MGIGDRELLLCNRINYNTGYTTDYQVISGLVMMTAAGGELIENLHLELNLGMG